MPNGLPIRILRSGEAQLAAEHMERHSAESGRGGDIVFAPFEEFDGEAWCTKRAELWRIPIDEPGWERLWAAFDGDKVVGHVTLNGASLEAAMHRVRLGIGIERAHRGRGLGRELMQTALAWAHDEPSFAWVDLGVFTHNRVARALYANLGFVEVATVTDLFRVRGRSIDDVTMTLRLR